MKFFLLCACSASALIDYGDPSAREEQTAPILADATPPVLTVNAVEQATSSAVIIVSGQASDETALASVWIETIATPRIPVMVNASAWSSPVTLNVGDNVFAVIAEDAAGNRTRVAVSTTRTRVITLRANLPMTRQTTLRLDREQLLDEALMPLATRQAIQLIEVPLRPVVKNALIDIAGQLETLTPGTAEYNLSKLLNMTPDNADLSGTSVENLVGVAGGIGIPPERLLADLLLVEPTERIVDLGRATQAMLDYLMGSHPNATRNAEGELVLRMTLDDVLNDMHTLKSRFGPSGGHPGFVPPGGVVESKVLLPGFAMELPLTTNLRPYDGIDAARDEKDIVYVREGESVLSFDFYSPSFTVVGIADEPTLDMDIVISESGSRFVAGSQRTSRPDGVFYRGSSAVWDAAPWLLERQVAELAYAQFREAWGAPYSHRFTYYVYPSCETPPCAGNDVASIQWDKGWLAFAATGVTDLPPQQYVWDLLLEAAQLRLHDGGIPEGQAGCAFALKRIPVGLTAEALIAQTRPVLQAQEAELSAAIAGQGGLVAPRAEVYYKRAFGQDVLVNRLTSEEVAVSTGDTLDFVDAIGRAQRLTVVNTHADGIDVTLEPR